MIKNLTNQLKQLSSSIQICCNRTRALTNKVSSPKMEELKKCGKEISELTKTVKALSEDDLKKISKIKVTICLLSEKVNTLINSISSEIAIRTVDIQFIHDYLSIKKLDIENFDINIEILALSSELGNISADRTISIFNKKTKAKKTYKSLSNNWEDEFKKDVNTGFFS